MFFNLPFPTIVLRFYLMMLVVVIAGFTGQWWFATLSLPIFLSIMLGYTFKKSNSGKVRKMETFDMKERKAS